MESQKQNTKKRLSKWYKARAYQQLYESGVFEVSANVTNLSMDVPGEEKEPKAPVVSQPENADYGTQPLLPTEDGNAARPAVMTDKVQKAIDAIKELLSRKKHTDRSGKRIVRQA